MSDSEYHAATGKIGFNLQQLIEEPELYRVAQSLSSTADQLEIILARLDDFPELAEGFCTSLGIEVYDTLCFYFYW